MSIPGFILVFAMAFTGCQGETPASPAPASGPVGAGPASSSQPAETELRFDQVVAHQDIEMRWLELQDSRCPTGVVCIWAGQIVVTLEVTRGEDEAVEVELVNKLRGEPDPARAFDYELRLLGVDPHPKEGVTPEREDYVARIEISQP